MNTETLHATTKTQVPRRRRTYVINPSFQWKYTLITVATVFILSGFLTVVLFNVLHQQARAAILEIGAQGKEPASISSLLDGALERELKWLAKRERGGDPWPEHRGRLPGGRPPK